MKPFLITLATFLLFWLIGGIYYLFFHGISIFTFHTDSVSSEPVKTYEEIVYEKQKIAEQDTLYKNKALQLRDSSFCAMIKDQSNSEECRQTLIAFLAVASGSIEACDTLSFSGIATECRDAIYQKTAIESLSPVICNKLSNSLKSDFCHETVDEKSLRILIASGTLTNGSCLQFATWAKNDCEQHIKENQSNIVIQNGITSGNADNCTQISIDADRELCNDTVNLRNALEQNNKNSCENIIDTGKKNTASPI